MTSRLLDAAAGAAVTAIDTSHRLLATCCDRVAAELEDTAGLLRWLAAACRATP